MGDSRSSRADDSSSRSGARRPGLTRSIDIGPLQDAFLISAVAMILVIRLQLWLTDYPQLGSGELHIAHLLWGGALMVIALGLSLSFVGRSLRMPAAIIGGIGFGFFIDELGKFITEDNDYFFKPAAGIIYLIFVILYLLTRWMQRRRGFGPREYLVNAVDHLVATARRGFQEDDRERILAMLGRSDPDEPMTAPLRELVEDLEAAPARQPNLFQRAGHRAGEHYRALIERPWFGTAISIFFGLWAVISVASILILALALTLNLGGASGIEVDGVSRDHLSFINIASATSTLVAGLFVIVGVVRLRRDGRLAGYHWFERALLVQIFIGEFFAFVESQFHAVFGLALNVALLITLRFMIRREEQSRDATERPQESRPVDAKLLELT